MTTITERLGLSSEVRELQLGKSFKASGGGQSRNPSASGSTTSALLCPEGEAFHSLRYDFKPASVDTNKMGRLEFGDNSKVTVTAPNVEGSGLLETVYKGSRKPHLRECVLVIDHETGEITLERLGQNIVVKKTRAEGSSKMKVPSAGVGNRPLTPSIELEAQAQGQGSRGGKKWSPSVPDAQQKSISPKLQGVNSAANGSSKCKASPTDGFLSSHSIGHRSPSEPTHHSMPTSSAMFSAPMNAGSTLASNRMEEDAVGVLSESSSDSSGNESSDSSNSDSNSSDDEDSVEKDKGQVKVKPEETPNKPSPGSDSSSASSDSESEDERPDLGLPSGAAAAANKSMPNVLSMPTVATLPTSSMPTIGQLSMPKFTQLSEDLRLSEESADDSDNDV